MPLLSPKRQITIPKELCDRLQIQPGDDIDIVEHAGHVTLIKKHKGASRGVLGRLKADKHFSDADSLASTLAARRGGAKGKRQAA